MVSTVVNCDGFPKVKIQLKLTSLRSINFWKYANSVSSILFFIARRSSNVVNVSENVTNQS